MVYVKLIIVFLSFRIIRCHVDPIIIVHGGADNHIPEDRLHGRLEGVKKAVSLGYKMLKRGSNALDTVEETVKFMESDVNLNAGYGSVVNSEGEVEMDASIMVGSNLSSGAVSVVKNIEHPVSLARLVMERTPHFMLAGEGARRFAKEQHVPLIANLVTQEARDDLQKMVYFIKNRTIFEMQGGGSVAAIALDSRGHLAAAASSGGITGKMPGRVSSVSCIGAGIYADDEVGAAAVSGFGESIVRYNLAHEIINNMKRGFEAGLATRNAVKGLTEKFRRPSGAITLSKNGQIGISFTTQKMPWAYILRGDIHFGVDDYDHFSERIIL